MFCDEEIRCLSSSDSNPRISLQKGPDELNRYHQVRCLLLGREVVSVKRHTMNGNRKKIVFISIILKSTASFLPAFIYVILNNCGGGYSVVGNSKTDLL